MIEPSQCRAARALLNWTQPDLARETGLSAVTVRAFERGNEMRDSNRNLLRYTFERAGVVFDLDTGTGPGVRFKSGLSNVAATHPAPVGPATDALKRMEADIHDDRKRIKPKPKSR